MTLILNLRNLPAYDPGDLVNPDSRYVEMWCVIDWCSRVCGETVRVTRKEAIDAYKEERAVSDAAWRKDVAQGFVRAVKCAVAVPG